MKVALRQCRALPSICSHFFAWLACGVREPLDGAGTTVRDRASSNRWVALEKGRRNAGLANGPRLLPYPRYRAAATILIACERVKKGLTNATEW